MFLASILICYIDHNCQSQSSRDVYPNEFVCQQAIFNAVEYYKTSEKIQYVEGQCIKWGSRTGG